jgi:RluA family pseudouridine synthase
VEIAQGRQATMSNIIKLSSPATHEYWEVPVLYEDESLLALNKPSRLLTSPDRYDPERPNLMRLLHDAIKKGSPWCKERHIDYLANAHRLDFETSGIILLAKNKPALIALANQFGSDKPLKTYLALIEGVPLEPVFDVDLPLSPHSIRPGLMRIDTKNGKKSFTHFETLERFLDYTLLKCQPKTGRTHQIRVHLRSIDLPVVADGQYGGRQLFLSKIKPKFHYKGNQSENPLMGRLALHAEQLVVRHPVTDAVITIIAPWPKDLTVAVKYLRRYAAIIPPPDIPGVV